MVSGIDVNTWGQGRGRDYCDGDGSWAECSVRERDVRKGLIQNELWSGMRWLGKFWQLKEEKMSLQKRLCPLYWSQGRIVGDSVVVFSIGLVVGKTEELTLLLWVSKRSGIKKQSPLHL